MKNFFRFSSNKNEEEVTEEIISMVDEAHEQGVIQENEAEMIQNVESMSRDLIITSNECRNYQPFFGMDVEKILTSFDEVGRFCGYHNMPTVDTYARAFMEVVKRTSYRVEVIEWFGTEKETVLLDWSTFNKDEANRNFQIAYGQANM